jgi:hypothetical protein
MIKIIGTTLLAAAGVCGSAVAWSHMHNPQAAEARGNSRRERFSRRQRGESSFARDFATRGNRRHDRAWDNRGR